uniref:Uncharacterized protein n=1 Tax=viral metagenome TaxID=1070528 RepID=A0A6C0AHV8_9ZZZZ
MVVLFVIELLMHCAFFLIFLTTFYFTYVGYIQNISLVKEISSLGNEYVSLGKVDKSGKPQFTNDSSEENQRIVTYVGVSVGLISALFIGLAITLSILTNHSVFELIVSNLITISFIAVTDIVILSIFGLFQVLQKTFMTGLLGKIASGQSQSIKCDMMKTTVERMFPGMKSFVDQFF